MNIRSTELLAHTAWNLSEIYDKKSMEFAMEILSKIENEISNAVSMSDLNGGRYRIEDFYGIRYVSSSDLIEWRYRISNRYLRTKERYEMLGEITQGIAEQIRMNQDTKEMTRRAIKILESLGENADDLRAEFQATYGEEV